jgi:hypothetical protein
VIQHDNPVGNLHHHAHDVFDATGRRDAEFIRRRTISLTMSSTSVGFNPATASSSKNQLGPGRQRARRFRAFARGERQFAGQSVYDRRQPDPIDDPFRLAPRLADAVETREGADTVVTRSTFERSDHLESRPTPPCHLMSWWALQARRWSCHRDDRSVMGYKQHTQLNSDVLPAPFGPMMQNPCCDVESDPGWCQPPNRLTRCALQAGPDPSFQRWVDPVEGAARPVARP